MDTAAPGSAIGTDTRTPIDMPYDVIRADLPPGFVIQASTGRMFRVTEVPSDERRAIFAETPALDERGAVVKAVSQREARELCTALRSEYDAAARAVARAVDGDARRYAVRTSAVDAVMAANPGLGA